MPRPIVERLRNHAYVQMEQAASLRLGRSIHMTIAYNMDLENLLHEAADLIEKQEGRISEVVPMPVLPE